MTFYRCVTGEGMYFSFDAVCKNNQHPSTFGEHTLSILCVIIKWLIASIYGTSMFCIISTFLKVHSSGHFHFVLPRVQSPVIQQLFTFAVMVKVEMLL